MSYWKDRTVLVTGGHGFVGRNLIKELSARGPSDIIIPTKEDCDLTDEEAVWDLFSSNHFSDVIHLAGKVGGIKANKEAPAEFFFHNIMMGTLVTHYAHACGVGRMVSLAAGCGYPKYLKAPFKEEDFWSGMPDENSIGYSMAKKNLIIQSLAYREQYGFNSTVLLPANLYGPHDNFDLETSHVVPALIRKFIEAKENNLPSVEVWGSGEASREFLYVGDLVRAILDVTESYNETGPLNLGTGTETTIRQLVDVISFLTEYDGEIKWNSDMPDGQPRRFYDMSKFSDAMGYIPNTLLMDGVKKTIEWYKNNN